MRKHKILVCFIRIKLCYLILPNKRHTEIVISKYNTQKIRDGFSNFEVEHTLHEFSTSPTILEKFYFYQRKAGPSVILSKKNLWRKFRFSLFHGPSKTTVTNFSVEFKDFETIEFKTFNVWANSSKLHYFFKVNCQIFIAK